MTDEPRSNRPTPRTPAAMEAELRRRLRIELGQARAAADGELDDASLAAALARAIALALGWHLEAPEHTRYATQTSRGWRPAAGPRGAVGPSEPGRGRGGYPERGPRPADERRGRGSADERRAPRPDGGQRGRKASDEEMPGGRPAFGARGGRRPPSGGGGGFGPKRRGPRRG